MRKKLEKEKLEDLGREINDGKVLMWGAALDQTRFPRERRPNGSSGGAVGPFPGWPYLSILEQWKSWVQLRA